MQVPMASDFLTNTTFPKGVSKKTVFVRIERLSVLVSRVCLELVSSPGPRMAGEVMAARVVMFRVAWAGVHRLASPESSW